MKGEKMIARLPLAREWPRSNLSTASIFLPADHLVVIPNGVNTVVFDRAGYKYHGRVRALAEAAREAGLGF